MLTDQFKVGKQPCSKFKSMDEDYRFSGNVHSCIYCNNKTVSFCENCCKDHHENGYETCKNFKEDKHAD